MISEQDLRQYFTYLPKNIEIEINGNIYKCNKFCLISFSSILEKLIEKSEDKEKQPCTYLSLTNDLSDIPKDKIDVVLNFIHGLAPFDEQNMSTFEDIFLYYYIASVLGINIIRNRLCSRLTKLVSSDNVSYIYKKLSSYPDFCEPIIRYFDNNDISIFNSFIHENILTEPNNILDSNSLSFFHAFLKNSMNLFQKESIKLSFVQSLNEQTQNSASSLVFYNYIRPEELDHTSIIEIFPRIPLEASPYLSCFKLIANLVKEKQKLTETLKRARNRLNNSIADLEEAKTKRDNRKLQFSESAMRISYEVQTKSSICKQTKEISGQLELLAADVALISVQNEATVRFLDHIDQMYQISDELFKLMQSFYENGGYIFWPGSSVNTLNNSKSLHGFMESLVNDAKIFRPDNNALNNLSRYFLRICDELKQVELI